MGRTAPHAPGVWDADVDRGASRGESGNVRAHRPSSGSAPVSDVVDPDLGRSRPGGAAMEDSSPKRPARLAPRRRPSGRPPPLPHDLRTSGAGWLICGVVAIVTTVLVFRHGLRGVAIDVV